MRQLVNQPNPAAVNKNFKITKEFSMKNMLALTFSLCVLSVMIHASDAQPHSIDLRRNEKQYLKECMIILIKPTLTYHYSDNYDYFNNVLDFADVSVIYNPRIQKYFVKLMFSDTPFNRRFNLANQSHTRSFSKEEFAVIIDKCKPKFECCC